MKEWFWTEGRFSWPLVIAIVFLTLSIVVADYIWRVAVIPFERLVLYVVAGDVSIAAILILGSYLWFRQSRRKRSGH